MKKIILLSLIVISCKSGNPTVTSDHKVDEDMYCTVNCTVNVCDTNSCQIGLGGFGGESSCH